MNKPTGLLFNSTSIFISSVIIYAAKFLTSVTVARSLGIEGKGSYALVITVASMLQLAVNLGLNSSITYLTASKKFTSGTLFGFALLATLVLSALGSILFIVLYRFILVSTILKGFTLDQAWLVIGILPFILLQSFLLNILLGLQKIIAYTTINMTFAVLNLAFQAVSYLLHLGLMGALGAWALANIIETLLLIVLLLREAGLTFHGIRPVMRPSLSFGIKSYVANLTSFFNLRLDTFVINGYLGKGDLGLYTTGVSVAEFLWYLPNAISSALFPKVSSLNESTAHQLTARATRITLVVIFLASVILGAAGVVLIPLIFGEAFRLSIYPFLWLLPGVVAMSVSKLLSANLSGIGKPKYTSITATIAAIVTLILDLLMIPRLGIVGAALASSFAYILIACILVVWFTKESGLRWHQVVVPNRDDWKLIAESFLNMLARALNFQKHFTREVPRNRS